MAYSGVLVLAAISLIALADGANRNVIPTIPAPMEQIRSEFPSSRIVAGWPAEEAQIPHQINLRMISRVGAVSLCGGSIIHHNWVVTAAHCCASLTSYTILYGLTNRTRPAFMLETTQRYIHPEYDEIRAGVQTADIALLQVFENVPYSRHIQPIRMMNRNQKNLDFTGVVFTASGFGLTDDTVNGGVVSEVLQWVHLRGISNEECLSWYSGSVIDKPTICAEFYNDTAQSSCNGDSGGPLTFLDFDGRPTMIGVCSFGSRIGCNSPWPSGWVRPGHYHDWFEQITGLSFDWLPYGSGL